MSYDPTKPFTVSGELRPMVITIGGGTHRDRVALLNAATIGLHATLGAGVSIGYDVPAPDSILNINPLDDLSAGGRFKVRVSYDLDHLPAEPVYATEGRGLIAERIKQPYAVKVNIFGQDTWVASSGLVDQLEFANTYETLPDIVNVTEAANVRELVHEYNFNNCLGSEYSHFDYADRLQENNLRLATVEIWHKPGTPEAKLISNQLIPF